jgi:hypothetical protein
MIFVILGVLALIQIGLTFALAAGLKRLVPVFPAFVRYCIAFAAVFMILAMILAELIRGVAA